MRAAAAQAARSCAATALPLLAYPYHYLLFYVFVPVLLFATAQRRGEPAWHRRQRRKRGDARALLRVASAAQALSAHHSSQPAAHPMVRGRWSRDDDGWVSRNARGRSQSRGRSSRRDNGAEGNNDSSKDYRKECEKLRKQLDDARKRNDRQSQPQVPRPNAREGPSRDGDWLCSVCAFATNRSQRQACYRCMAAKGLSFPAGSVHTSAGAVVAAGQPAGTPLAIPTSTTAATIPSFSPSTSPPSSSTLSGSSVAFGWFPQQAPGHSGPVVVPGFAGAPAVAMQPSPSTVVEAQPAPCAKALKGQLDALLQTRAAVAANPLCSEAVATIDGQIAKTRNELAQAQPLEVALRGTLGAVANARQAVQRAEAKLAKCEQQVVTSVAAYEAAAVEAQTLRKQLADAEAATARTAGAHADLRQLFSTDPGAAWAAFRMAAEARCVPGAVDPAVCARASAAFAEMQAICALLPSQPPPSDIGGSSAAVTSAPGQGVQGGSPSSPISNGGGGAAAAAAGAGQPPQGQPGPGAASGMPPTAPSTDAGAIAAAAITAAIAQQNGQQFVGSGGQGADGSSNTDASTILHPSSPEVPSHFELVAAAAGSQPTAPATASDAAESVPGPSEAEREIQGQAATAAAAAQRARDQEAQEQAAAAAVAAASTQQPREPSALAAAAATCLQVVKGGELGPLAAKEASGGTGPPPHVSGDANGGCGRVGSAHQLADDSMGGGASDGVAGKRSHAAIAAGRSIAAKAKAKTSA